jgi:hypothetical protein
LDKSSEVTWCPVLNIQYDGNVPVVANGHPFSQIICCCHKNNFWAGVYSLQKLQFRQILRVNNADGLVILVHDDQIVDTVLIKGIEHFDSEFTGANRDWMADHMPVDRVRTHLRISLESTNKVTVRENPMDQ